jgi:hypothetical protein
MSFWGEESRTVDVQLLLGIREMQANASADGLSQEERQRLAEEALVWSGYLVERLSKWAIEELGREFWSRDRDGTQGAAWVAERHWLSKLLARGGVLPGPSRRHLMLALAALDNSEIHPLLAPDGKGRGSRFTLGFYQRAALFHVYFEIGKGSSKEEAIALVAEAMGAAKITVISWERRKLPRLFPGIETSFEVARRAGVLAASPEATASRDHSARTMLDLLTASPLDEIAAEYRSFLAHLKGRSPRPGLLQI